MSTSTLAYGATRAGKSHLLASMRPAGRLCVADIDGKFAAEMPEAYIIQTTINSDRSPEAVKAAWNIEFEAANDAPGVIWPIYTPSDLKAFQVALASRRIVEPATIGIDSLTYMFEKIISHICGTAVMTKKTKDEEEPLIDPVMISLPDFSGANVQRPMRRNDWQTFAQKVLELVAGMKAVAEHLGAHFVCTALEEKRDIVDQKTERLLETRMGPMIQGRAAGPLIPPLFGLFLRLAQVSDEKGVRYGAFTQPRGGWPAGVVGPAAQLLPPVVENPNLWDILGKVGLQ